MDTIIAGNYSETGRYRRSALPMTPCPWGWECPGSIYTGTYPVITGQDCDIANVKNMLNGKQGHVRIQGYTYPATRWSR